jgi:hypothetical protein
MIFQEPWAWLGLVAIAWPIAAHLLTRHRARRVRFPILRFMPLAVAPTTKRHRLSDAGLLFVRCAIVAVAVGALARPLWRDDEALGKTDTATSPSAPSSAVAREDRGTSGAPAVALADGVVRFLTGASEQDAAVAAWSAAVATGAPAAGRSDRRIAIVTPLFDGRERLIAQSSPINAPWMFDVLHTVTSDRLFDSAVTRAGGMPATAVTARRGSIDGVERLLLVTEMPASSVATAALAGAVARAAARPDAPIAPTAPAPAASPSNDGHSDGRWLWLGVLMLFGVESLMRQRRQADPVEVRRAA